MKKEVLHITMITMLAILFSGCASSGIVELDKGMYYISKPDSTPGLGPPSASVISDVYKEANNFCARKNSVVKTIKSTILDAAPGRMGSIKLEFTCIKK